MCFLLEEIPGIYPADFRVSLHTCYCLYGNRRCARGSIGADKGYTGQFADVLTGLDYYNALV